MSPGQAPPAPPPPNSPDCCESRRFRKLLRRVLPPRSPPLATTPPRSLTWARALLASCPATPLSSLRDTPLEPTSLPTLFRPRGSSLPVDGVGLGRRVLVLLPHLDCLVRLQMPASARMHVHVYGVFVCVCVRACTYMRGCILCVQMMRASAIIDLETPPSLSFSSFSFCVSCKSCAPLTWHR